MIKEKKKVALENFPPSAKLLLQYFLALHTCRNNKTFKENEMNFKYNSNILRAMNNTFSSYRSVNQEVKSFNKHAESYVAKKLFWSSPENKQTLPKGIFTVKFEYCLMFTYIINVNKTAYYFSCIVMDYGVYMA